MGRAAVAQRFGTLIEWSRLPFTGDALEEALGAVPSPGASPGVPSIPADPARPLPRSAIATLDQAMRGHIEAALAATGGKIEGSRGAGRLLGINPHTLRARMRKLGIDWARFREG